MTTTKLRALMQAWGSASAGGSSGILEFEAWAAQPAEPSIDVELTVTTRCVASKVALVVTAANHDEVPATVAVTTPYGAKTFAAVAPDAQSSAVFSTRLPSMPAGSATAAITATVDGEAVETDQAVEYVASSCGAR